MKEEVSPGPSLITSRFEALRALYDNKQQWVRHYEALLAQIIPLSTTASLSICAYLIQNPHSVRYPLGLIALPVTLTVFAAWFIWWCDAEIKRQFDQIVIAEIGMCFYEIRVEGREVLPSFYRNSPNKMRPMVIAGYVAQATSVVGILVSSIVLLP